MRALKVLKPNKIELIEEIEPKIESNQILVFPIAVGICRTDLAIIKGKIDPAFIRYPITLGHEWVGRVENGDRVVVEGIIPVKNAVNVQVKILIVVNFTMKLASPKMAQSQIKFQFQQISFI